MSHAPEAAISASPGLSRVPVEEATRDGEQTWVRRIAGGALVLGGLLSLVGFFVRPVAIQKGFSVSDVLAVEGAAGVWVLSFRLLVFGLFVRIAGLVALGSFSVRPSSRAIIAPGVTISVAALVISALAQGYHMDIGIHAVWRFQTELTDAARQSVLQSFIATDEWVSCLSRMGVMFLGLGSAFLGGGLARETLLPRVVPWGFAAVGATSMMALFLSPGSHTLFVGAFAVLAASHVAMGAILLMRKRVA